MSQHSGSTPCFPTAPWQLWLAGVAQGDGIWPPPRWMRCLQHASCPGCGSLRAEGSMVPAALIWQSLLWGGGVEVGGGDRGNEGF